MLAGFYEYSINNSNKIVYYSKKSGFIYFSKNDNTDDFLGKYFRKNQITYWISPNFISVDVVDINLNNYEFIYLGNTKIDKKDIKDLNNEIFYEKIKKSGILNYKLNSPSFPTSYQHASSSSFFV